MKTKNLEHIYAASLLLIINLGVFLLSNKFIGYFLFVNNGKNKASLFLDILFTVFAFAYMFLGHGAYKKEKRKSLGILFVTLGFLLALYYIPLAASLAVKIF